MSILKRGIAFIISAAIAISSLPVIMVSAEENAAYELNAEDSYPAELSGAVLEDGNFKQISVGHRAAAEAATVIAAAYDSGKRLTKLMTKPLASGNVGTETVISFVDDKNPNGIAIPDNGEIKVFVWGGSSVGSSLKPMSDAFSVTAQSPETTPSAAPVQTASPTQTPAPSAAPTQIPDSGNTAPQAPTGLLTNELPEPLNVEIPTFGWLVNDADENEIQTAYEILVTDEVTGDTAWDSGKVESSEQSYVVCGGKLEAGHPYSWKVKTWDKNDTESPYSEEAHFATGLSASSDWGASWISDGTGGASAREGTYNHFWYARKSDTLDSSKTVAKALAYISGLQDYDLYVNNTEIGRGQSFDYASESRYQGWDITEAVKKNSSAVAVGALVRTYGGGQGRAAVNAGLLGHINIFYTDGTVKTIVTDKNWKVSKSVPFSGTTKRNGEGDFVENYNAQNAQENFTSADFNDSSWTEASDRTVDEEISKVIPELSKPTSYEAEPVSIEVLSDGTTVADFGAVIPARPLVTFKNGAAGKSVTIQGGYMVNSDGKVNTSSSATQSTNMTWTYVEKAGEQTYNAWDHLGFRYLQIPSCGETFTKETLRARIVHTNIPSGRDSTFTSSNEMLDNVYELMKRSAIYGVQNEFVDTPTREKGQFTDDSRNISEAAMATQFEREASKKAIDQFLASADRYWTGNEAGRYNSVYPNVDGKRDIPEYSVNIPQWVWNYYMHTGDAAMLKKAYPYIKATADYISANIKDSGLVERLAGGDGSPNSYQYGIVDWPEPGRFGYDWSGTKQGARTTINMLSKHAFDAVGLAAAELGYENDEADMKARSAALTEAINAKLINDEGLYIDGTNGSGAKVSHVSQHANSFALAFDVVSDSNKDKVAEYIAEQGMRQGPMTADILVKGLFNAGKNTAALKLFTEPLDYGWAKEVANGFTFTWESWMADGVSRDDSQSHAWGSTAASDILRNFAGVQNLEPGAKEVKIAPVYTDLTSLDAKVSTERGFVGVKYERDDTKFDITVTVPANVQAQIELPLIGDGEFKRTNGALTSIKSGTAQIFNAGSGTYSFSYDGNITVLPEKVVYNENTDTDIYDFSGLSSETFNSSYTGEYKFNNLITLNFGTGSTSISNSGNGFDMYNDGAYIAFTPDADGKVSLDIIMRSASGGNKASTIYMSDTSPNSGGTSLRNTVSSNDRSFVTVGEFEVKAGTTYYFYNTEGRPTSIKSMTYTYPHVPLEGIKGFADTGAKTYTWEIGNASPAAAGAEYKDTDNGYVDLTVSLGTGDFMSEDEGIRFSDTSVGESSSVNDTKRYLIVTPEYNGTFSIDIAFSEAASNKKNRIYYRDLGTEDLDLTKYNKSGTQLEGDITDTGVKTKTLDMTAGHTYILYTYQRSSTISAMSYTYTEGPAATEIPKVSDGLDKKYMHISFDDVYACLKDITDNKDTYTSVFENSMLKDLKELHDTYGAVFTLNCFIKTTKNSGYDISNLPDKYADELKENASWLKFAFHAQDDNATYGSTTATSSGKLATEAEAKASYDKFTAAILKATGNNTSSIDTVTRLGFFSGNEANVKVLSECDYGITGLLTADDSRVSYYFDTNLNNHIIQNGYYYDADKNLKLIRTQTRLESISNTSNALEALKLYSGNMVEIFTHESEYSKVAERLKTYVEWAKNNGYGFGYAMDLIKAPSQQPEIADNIPYETPQPEKSVTEPSGSSITLDRTSYPLVVGNTSKTDFSSWEDQGSEITITAALDDGNVSDLQWSVDNEDIAYISSSTAKGVGSVRVKGKRTGDTRLSAALPNGDTAVCYLSVIDNATRSTVQTLELNTNSLTLAPGASAELIPIINPKDIFGNGALDTSIGWASSDNNVATVNNGVITARSVGTAVIMAKSKDVGRKAYCQVTVTAEASPASIDTMAAGDTVGMTVGETKPLTASARQDITWRSDNSFIADVDQNGNVTAYANTKTEKLVDNESYEEGNTETPLKASKKRIVFEDGKVQYDQGTVKIYATATNGAVTTYNVSISDAPVSVQSIAISEDKAALRIGDTKTLKAAVLPANAMDKRVTWSSSDTSVAAVGANALTAEELCSTTVTGVSAGTAVISAECEGVKAECEVTVTADTVSISDITITNAKEIDIDEVLELETKITENAADTELLWISSDADVVSVNDDGMIQGLRSGIATIYAVAADSISDRSAIEALQYERTAAQSDLDAFLSGKTYGSCDITVRESSPYLRNLHIPKEAITDNSVNLLWNRASLLDTGDFDSFNVYVNGSLTANTKTLGYTVNNLEPNKEYTFKVEAVTAGGTVLETSSITAVTRAESTVINVMDAPYNAAGDGKHTDTLAIQRAIDACPENGTVYLPEGHIFYSGALFLKSNMTFKVDGILLGSTYAKDYPFMVTRWEGWRKVNQKGSAWANTTDSLPDNHYAHSSLINAGTYDEGREGHTGAYNVENLVICGNGQINGNGFKLGYNEGINQKTGNGGIPVPMTPAIDQTIRGRTITIHNAENVYLKDVQIAYSPSWTIHPIYNKNLTVDNIDVVSKGSGKTGAADDICILNGDGIDPESSVKVNIFNTFFRTGDDAVAVKTGRNREGNELKKPGQFIRITDSESNSSKGGFAVGSENASGVRNVLMQNLKVRSITLSDGICFKTYWSRGGMSENIQVKDIDSDKKIEFAMNYSSSPNNPAAKVPEYRYITVENTNSSVYFIGLGASTSGSEQHEATYVNNVTVRGASSGTINYGRDFTIWDSSESKWSQSNTSNINFAYSDGDTNTRIKIKDGAAHISSVDNDNHTIIAVSGSAAADVLGEIESAVPGSQLTYDISDDGKTLTVTAQDGVTTAEYTISYAIVWDFSKYTTEVKTTESGFTENYDGLTIAIANNGGDSSHDYISSSGVYWRGGGSSGESARYISYTPSADGVLTVTGKVNASSGRLGISDSIIVTSLKADGSSITSTSEAAFSKECKAGTTYYIMPKDKSATVTSIAYAPK